jgi:hemerythrin
MEEYNYMVWTDRYKMGLALIDEQHKGLFTMTNELYQACQAGRQKAREYFLDVIHQIADYALLHFAVETKLMEAVAYPRATEHKRHHDAFTLKVLEAARELEQGKLSVPKDFVHYLRDWILSHIAIEDRDYLNHIKKCNKLGELGELEEQSAGSTSS